MVNLLLAVSNMSHLIVTLPVCLLGLIRYIACMCFRFLDKRKAFGKLLLPVNFGTGLDLHGVHI